MFHTYPMVSWLLGWSIYRRSTSGSFNVVLAFYSILESVFRMLDSNPIRTRPE